MDKMKTENLKEEPINPINPITLAFLGFFSIPPFLALSFDVLAYGPYVFYHFKDIIYIGVILGDDFAILSGLLELRDYLKKGILKIDKQEEYAIALVVGLFIMLINFPLLLAIVLSISLYLPSNLQNIFIIAGTSILFAIIVLSRINEDINHTKYDLIKAYSALNKLIEEALKNNG